MSWLLAGALVVGSLLVLRLLADWADGLTARAMHEALDDDR